MLECHGEGEPGVRAGHTGLDFVAIEPHDELPAWARPQGGIGTRINVSLSGFSADVALVGLTTQFITRAEQAPLCGSADDCAELETCYEGTCRTLVGTQTNARLPMDCLADGTVHVPELSMRFRNDFPLEDLDGTSQDLVLTFEPREGAPVTSSVPVTLRVGEFVLPSWWETGTR